MASTSYVYQPVHLPDQTRVLVLAPGKLEDPLVGSLSTISIASSDEPYEALSYCWSRSVVVSEEPDPELKVAAAVYGTDEDGNPVNKGEEIAVKDLLNHPYYESFYIRMGGRLPDGVLLLDETPVTIGGELYRALRQLRDEDKPLRIWVDALCINQSDIPERNEHVKIMGQIYRGASHVRIWLGEVIGMESELHHTLDAINEALDNLLVRDGLLEKGASLHEIQCRFMNSPKKEHLQIQWERITEFVDRAWFERTWVIQEIANARKATIHIGPYRFSWEDVTDTLFGLRSYHIDYAVQGSKGIKAALMMRWLQKELVTEGRPHAAMDFLALLEELRDFKSTLPSDKLYSVVGLSDYKDKLVIDYSRPPEQVFTDFAIDQLQTNSLDILTHCVDIPSQPSTLRLPSWVPDWTRPGWVEPLRIRGLLANACGSTIPSFHINRATNTLTVKGRLIDRIRAVESAKLIPHPVQPTVTVTDPDQALQTMDPARRTMHLVRQRKVNARQTYWNILTMAFSNSDHLRPDDVWEALWRTVMCNRTRDNEAPDPVACARGFEVHLELIRACGEKGLPAVLMGLTEREVQAGRVAREPVKMQAWVDGLTAGYEMLAGANSKWCYNRRFCRSVGDRFGWVVDGVREGDVVAVFYGGKYPFVLREVEDGSWRIVGDCYLHGIMDGEGMDEVYKDTERDFVIV